MIFNNNKGELSKVAIVYSVSLFYIALGLFLGFFGDTFGDVDIEEQSVGDGLFGLGNFSFFGNIVLGIGIMPLWLSTLIFTPLSIMLLYLLISSLPFFN